MVLDISKARHGCHGRAVFGACIAALLFGIADPARGQVTFDTVAIGGGPAPGLPGVFIADPIVPPGSLFVDMALNARGEVACAFVLEGPDVADNNLAAWVGRPGDLKLLARKGEPAPGAPNTIFLSVGGTFDASFNDLGQVAFITFLGGVGTDFSNNVGIWFGTPGDLRLVARKGSAFPGSVDGALFSEFGDIRLTAAADQPILTYHAAISGGMVTRDNDTAIFAGAPGVQQFLVRENDLAVPNNSNPLFSARHAQFSSASLNRHRSIVFQSRLRGLDVGFNNSEALFFSNAGGSPTLIVRTGTQAQPDRFIALIGLSPLINQENEIAFTATLFDNANQNVGDSLFTAIGSGIRLRAKAGDIAPGGASFSSDAANFLLLGLNALGDVLFSAFLQGAGTTEFNNHGLFVLQDGGIHLLARTGDPAPGMPGVTFGSVNGGLNRNGLVAFAASLRGPGFDDDLQTTESLWLIERDGTTPVHGHTALFGVYGMLGIGLMLFCLKGLATHKEWRTGALAYAFWSINIGLALMVCLSLLPVGVMQALASMKHGMWYARSAEFMQTPITETLRSARCRQRERPRPNGVYSTSARAVHD